MRIAFNPSTVAALTAPPNNKDITFDLRGRNIFARGVKFYGTDTNTWRDIKINNVSIGSHTLDLRNGSNTTLTNTNGVVTINSTWRPVVDNLTSNSTTSSLSANQGRVLKALIDGKSDSGHNHDGRYVRYYAVTTLDCNNLAAGLTAARVSATNAAHTNNSVYLYISDIGTPFQIQIPDSNVPYIYKRYYSSGKWSGWFKLNAGYADSAGSVAWANITGKPSSYTPSAHTHAWNSLTHSSTTENQAILTNGKANGWKLYTLNISGWNNAANNAHSHSNKSVLDGITSGLVNNWNTAYTFVHTITGTDTDKVINKWDEIVNFLAGITEDNKLNTLLNSKLSVYELADKTNVGTIKNNGIYYSTTDASSGTLTNSPFNTGFALINMTSYDGGDDLRRSRLAFNAYGEIKVSDDRGQSNTAETWYNVLTSKNSGISGSTIKLNGTSITVYSSGTADGRYVKKSGDTMSGALNLANNTWNKVGDDSYMGDCNVSGHFGIKAANTTYPGIAFFNNANAHLGSLTAYSGNIKYGAYSLQFLDNGNTSVNASTWTNPFSAYNSNAVKDGQAICVWGQSSYLSNLANDTGDISLWLKRVNAKAATLNMVLDGEYYANGTQRLAHVSEIPSSLKNPYALTISLNGTSQGPYDGSAAKSINITPGSIGAATSGHNHDGRYVYNYGGTQMDGASKNKNALGMSTTSGISGDWWHILQAAWSGEYRWNSQIAFPTQNRNGMYYRSGLDDNTKWGSWVKLLDVNNYSSTLDSRYYTESEVNSLLSNKLNTSDFNWTNLPGKIVAGNEFNIVNAGFKEHMWFNYLPINDRSKTATILSYCFGNGAEGYASIVASGFIKSGGNASQLLRADGGVTAFNWSGQAGQPTWLWGGNSQHSYYVYNPSNFRVAYAASAGNADTLDGEHANSFVRAGAIDTDKTDLNALDTYSFIKSVNSKVADHSPKRNTGWYNVIQLVHRNGAGDGASYIGQIALGMTTNTDDMFFRGKRTDSWKTVIHSGNISSQTVASATKLQTARKIWGQSFDGTADVSGTLSNAGHINFLANNTYDVGSNTSAIRYIYTYWIGAKSGQKLELGANNSTYGKGLCLDTNLNVGIGTNTPSYKLDVKGDIYSSGYARASSGFIKDSSSNAYVLLGGGSHKLESALNVAHANISSSANKLTTVRNIALGTDLRGSANFDGSSNIIINANINACTIRVGSTNGLPFKRIAHFETGSSWNDNALLLYISQGYINGSNGICRVEFRTDNISSSNSNPSASSSVRWLVRNGYNLDSLYVGYYVTTGKAYIDIYLKTTGDYQGTVIRVLQDSRGGINSNVQLIDSYYYSDTNHKEAYNSVEAASTALYNRAYTRIVSGSDVGTVSHANSASNADTTDGVHIKWAGSLTSTSHLVAWEKDGSALRDINPANVSVGYASSAGNASTLGGTSLSGLFTAFGNNAHNITATIGGVTKSFLVNWAADSDKLDGKHASDFAAASHTHKWADITDRITKLSQLTNDKGFVTGSVSGKTITINGTSTTWSNTWRPLGTGSGDAAAGNHTHKVKINGSEKIITATNAKDVVDLGTYLTSHQSLAGYVNTVETIGAGNAVTSIVKAGGKITANKGTTFLTSHQSLANYYTKGQVDAKLGKYLPLAGGTMDVGAQIQRTANGGMWYQGRSIALLRETSAGGYHALWSLKTTDGSWDFGEYNSSDWNNIPVLSYVLDSNFNKGSNTTTYQIKFPLASGTIALTSNILNPTNYYWANIKVSSSSSTTTSPTVHTLNATRVCAGHNPGIDNSISCSNWFRSSGNTGWYSTSYGGGWYMSDKDWIRTWGSKALYVNNTIRSINYQAMYGSTSVSAAKLESATNLVYGTDTSSQSINTYLRGTTVTLQVKKGTSTNYNALQLTSDRIYCNNYCDMKYSVEVRGDHFTVWNDSYLAQLMGSKVGIGTKNPQYTLDVGDKMRAGGYIHSGHNSNDAMLLAGGGWKKLDTLVEYPSDESYIYRKTTTEYDLRFVKLVNFNNLIYVDGWISADANGKSFTLGAKFKPYLYRDDHSIPTIVQMGWDDVVTIDGDGNVGFHIEGGRKKRIGFFYTGRA